MNRTGKLALQATLKSQSLLKLSHAKAVGLHHLEARHRPLWQTQGGQPQPCVMYLVRWNQDGAATLGMFVGDIHLRQLGHDGTTILVRKIGVQNPPLGLSSHEDTECANSHEENNAENQTHALRLIQA